LTIGYGKIIGMPLLWYGKKQRRKNQKRNPTDIDVGSEVSHGGGAWATN
jgi:hypothetical protein